MSEPAQAFVKMAAWTGIGGVLWTLSAPDFWLGFAFAYFFLNLLRYLAAAWEHNL